MSPSLGISLEYGSSMFLRSFGIYQQTHTASQPRIKTLPPPPQWELQVTLRSHYHSTVYNLCSWNNVRGVSRSLYMRL